MIQRPVILQSSPNEPLSFETLFGDEVKEQSSFSEVCAPGKFRSGPRLIPFVVLQV